MNGVFQSRDGTAIYYEMRGRGRPLLLAYGLLCRRDHWRHQIPHLESRYRVVLFDYRGHQRSALPRNEEHLTLEWCARDLQDLMDFLDLSEVSCLGHSMGVPVLTHLAALEPERVKANVFICGTVNNPFENMLYTHRLDPVFEFSHRLQTAAPLVSRFVWDKLTSSKHVAPFLAAQFGFNPELARDSDVQGYVQGIRETQPQVFYRFMQDYRRVDRQPLISQVRVPTLVVAGEDDCITPLHVQRKLYERLPNGELETIPGGSHNAHMDFPELVNKRIDRFFETVGYRS